jgi:1D-myo-inositol-tetrakisphosphate 5-kinase/inositol-polyphosphate multikinase
MWDVCKDGRVGSLVDDSGRFYKPLQDGSRGDKEVHFYERLWADKNIPPSVQKFFPKFYGTIGIDAPDGSGPINILNTNC